MWTSTNWDCVGILSWRAGENKFPKHPDLVIINHDKDPAELKVISFSLIKGHCHLRFWSSSDRSSYLIFQCRQKIIKDDVKAWCIHTFSKSVRLRSVKILLIVSSLKCVQVCGIRYSYIYKKNNFFERKRDEKTILGHVEKLTKNRIIIPWCAGDNYGT